MHNLPGHLPLLIGREIELAQLPTLLRDRHTRLLTLAGAGGCGKTRLALELAHQTVDEFPGGVWFVDLATLSEPALVPQAVVAVLGVREEPGRPLLDTLIGALRSRSALLVLDNCEHLVEACARLCGTLLGTCPELHILATSRERLGVGNEVTRQVTPLSVPDADHPPDERAITDYPAVRLFLDRARAAGQSLVLTRSTAQVVGEICSRLDGVPLAIELAAARLGVLNPEQILERLDSGPRLLSGGSRTAPPRQQTLQATLDWSHALLTHAEQAVFRRLAVFASGCDLEAAEAVCADDGIAQPDILDVLARLVNKSLVQVEARPSGARYRFLAPIRQYAAERLLEAGEDARVRDRHLVYWSEIVHQADVELRSNSGTWPERSRHMRQLEEERDNIRGALRWAIASDQIEVGLQMAAALSTPSYVWGLYAECRQWLIDLLSAPGASTLPSAAVALGSAGGLAFYQDDYANAQSLLEQSRSRWMEQRDRSRLADTLNSLSMTLLRRGDRLGALGLLNEASAVEALGVEADIGLRLSEAMTLGNLATLAYAEKDYIAATRLLEESCAIWRRIDNLWGLALGLTGLGFVMHTRGDLTAARALFQESLGVLREMDGPTQVARALAGLGRVALSESDPGAAREHFLTSLRLSRASGQRLGVVRCLEALAAVAAVESQLQRALRLVGAARAARRSLGLHEPGDGNGVVGRATDVARQRIGTRRAEELIAEGEAIDLEQAIALAVQGERRGDVEPHSVRDPLTRREREVALLLAEGLSNRQIAERLVISEKTAGLHVEHILGKLGLHSRWQVAEWLRQQPAGQPMGTP